MSRGSTTGSIHGAELLGDPIRRSLQLEMEYFKDRLDNGEKKEELKNGSSFLPLALQ